MKNQDIRNEAKKAKVNLWEVADALGITDFTLSRKLRYELPDEEKAEIFKIIAELKNV